MENLFKLLFYLFLALALMVVVLERFGKPMAPEMQYKWSRWILPLCALLLVLQLFRHYF
ncbi:MAG: hypothetical protein HKO07_00050 [Pseudomonadales bacterium]|nr:hypothetical protein [Gammaproteobacteria bacterium]NNC54089.1 hypothetical protein [Pseudomonadales bacterium]NNL56919.1 hypothetical protein [Pseudomonadales bacterium]